MPHPQKNNIRPRRSSSRLTCILGGLLIFTFLSGSFLAFGLFSGMDTPALTGSEQSDYATLSVITAVISSLALILLFTVRYKTLKPIDQITDTLLSLSEGDFRTPIHIDTKNKHLKDIQNALNILRETGLKSQILASFPEENPEPIIEINRDYQITYINQAGINEMPDLMSYGDIRYLLADDGEERLNVSFNLKRAQFLEQKINKKWFEIFITHITDQDDEILRLYFRNITRLKDAYSQIEQANNAKSDFLANMTHEIRTPLNGIIGTASLLNQTSMDARQASYCDTILSSGEVLLDLINDILDLSKIEAGAIEINPTQFHLKDALQASFDLFAGTANDKGLEYELQYDDALPHDIIADHVKIRQILSNLISNALKFTETGAVTVKAEQITPPSADTQSARIKLSVTDTGEGIDKKQQNLLFKKFSQIQASQDKTDIRGTGLGLSICKSLTEIMGGQISVESEAGKGSTFSIELDVKIAEQGKHSGTSGRIASQPPASLNLDAAVLLADDTKTNRTIIGDMLVNTGCHVSIAKDGEEAIEKCRNHTYDLILMDIRMPHINGIEATARIRKLQNQNASAPIVALTAYSMDSHRAEALAAGMNDFLTKPIRQEDLNRTLCKWLPEKQHSHNTDIFDTHIAASETYDNSMLADFIQNMPDRADKYIALTIDDIEDRMRALSDAFENEDVKAIHEISHAVASVAGQAGGVKFAKTAKQIEEMDLTADDQSYAKAAFLFNELQDMQPQIVAWLQSRKQKQD